jgi:hypothetical protein
MANTYVERQMSGNTASTKMTFSVWLKVSNPTTNGRVFGAQANACHTYFGGNGKLNVDFSAKDSGSVSAKLETNKLFKDTNAWYHIVFTLDTTLGTADDRIKLYVNGTQETSFNSRTNPGQNDTYAYGQSGYYNVGARSGNTGSAGHYFEGLMTHAHYCDGYAYAASAFGSTDATTGEWQINTAPSVTYGTNGFFILKDGNSVTDQSGNSNNFTASGTLTKAEDNPSNVFACLNQNKNNGSMGTFTHGSNTYAQGNANWRTALSTLGITSGKFYYEMKWVSGNHVKVGFALDYAHQTDHLANANFAGGYAWYQNSHGELRTDDGVINGWAGSDITNITNIATGDIMKVAIDMDNKFAYFGVNAVWAKNADPTSGSTGTGGFSIASEYPAGTTLMPGLSVYNATASINFGNGYFGTTAVSSAGTNASGFGIFEYDVPAGYTALCTKGLNL